MLKDSITNTPAPVTRGIGKLRGLLRSRRQKGSFMIEMAIVSWVLLYMLVGSFQMGLMLVRAIQAGKSAATPMCSKSAASTCRRPPTSSCCSALDRLWASTPAGAGPPAALGPVSLS